VPTADDDEILVTSDTALTFKDVTGTRGPYKFSTIQVHGPLLVGVEREQGATVNIDLAWVDGVHAKKFSPGKTALLTTGIVLASIPVTALGVLFVMAATDTFPSGRPLRVAGHASPVRAPLVRGPRGRMPALRSGRADEATRAKVFAHWAKEASAESASIPAFLALARDLKMASAPAGLVRAARRAAREEATHTEVCTALANDHAEMPIATLAPPTPENADGDYESLLQRLALEAFWDGSVAEGSAATVARESALLTKDETTRLALQTIARDEHAHAELAKHIVAYCLSAGGKAVRNALMESYEQKRAAEEAELGAQSEALTDESGVDEDFLMQNGVPGNDATRKARIETWEKSCAVLARA
jgi:hypothetical protein